LGSKDALSVDHDAGWRIAIPDNRRVVSPACSLLTTDSTTALLTTEPATTALLTTALLTTEPATTTLLTTAVELTSNNP
jgi:hypothetical protein